MKQTCQPIQDCCCWWSRRLILFIMTISSGIVQHGIGLCVLKEAYVISIAIFQNVFQWVEPTDTVEHLPHYYFVLQRRRNLSISTSWDSIKSIHWKLLLVKLTTLMLQDGTLKW